MDGQSATQMPSSGAPYAPLLVYNGTTATGGNTLTQDLNLYYQVR